MALALDVFDVECTLLVSHLRLWNVIQWTEGIQSDWLSSQFPFKVDMKQDFQPSSRHVPFVLSNVLWYTMFKSILLFLMRLTVWSGSHTDIQTFHRVKYGGSATDDDSDENGFLWGAILVWMNLNIKSKTLGYLSVGVPCLNLSNSSWNNS